MASTTNRHGEAPSAGPSDYADPVSGVTVRRLTAHQGHSNHLYFNIEGCWDGGTRAVIVGDRDGAVDLFSLDLADGRCTRLTDDASRHGGGSPCLVPGRDAACYWCDGELRTVDLRTRETRTVFRGDPGYAYGTSAVTADGAALLAVGNERGDDRFAGVRISTKLLRASYAAGRESRVLEIDLATGRERVLLASRQVQFGHPNPCPTDPDLLTVCHEGPWLEIDQRIWGLRRSSCEPWPVVPKDPEWGVGHEFWFPGGRTLGYHARHREGTWRHALGWSAVDNTESFRAEVAVPTHHAHAVRPERYVLDGTREAGDHLLVVERAGEGWAVPRVLCAHDTSRHHHRAHAHPHVCADGRRVLFTSDRGGYCDVYLVEIPADLADLPPYAGRPYRYYWE